MPTHGLDIAGHQANAIRVRSTRPLRKTMFKHTTASPAVAFVASPEFIEALDIAAAKHGATRSHYARNVLTQHLRDTGQLASDAPVTIHAAQRRSRSIPRS